MPISQAWGNWALLTRGSPIESVPNVCEKGNGSVVRKLGQIIERGPDRWLVRVLLGHDPATGRKRKCGAQI